MRKGGFACVLASLAGEKAASSQHLFEVLDVTFFFFVT